MEEKMKEKINGILSTLTERDLQIVANILQEEKKVLHRKTLQGSTIIKDVTEIFKERVK
jgi:DNA-directed RNA polymerase sigma subunit (sigma70/sigma32)